MCVRMEQYTNKKEKVNGHFIVTVCIMTKMAFFHHYVLY